MIIIFWHCLRFRFLDDASAARAHAVSVVQSIRTWSNRMFTTGLSRERNVEERKKILDEFYRRLVDQVAMVPADRGSDYAVNFVTVVKTSQVSDGIKPNDIRL